MSLNVSSKNLIFCNHSLYFSPVLDLKSEILELIGSYSKLIYITEYSIYFVIAYSGLKV